MSSTTPPDGLWSQVRQDTPVALLPVRLETRFGQRAEDGVAVPVLRVRIYPDELSVARPSLTLSAVENEAGRRYWEVKRSASATDHDKAAAWEVLCQRVSLQRAVFVARATETEEPPTQPVETPPVARLLPDAWVIVGEVAGAPVFTHYVRRSDGDLQVGLTRGGDAFGGKDSDVFAEADGLRWATDFAAAMRIGMAAEIDLTGDAESGARGLSALYVVGLREADPVAEVADFTSLLASHAASDRLAFVKTGTATNTLADGASGWSSTASVYAAEKRVAAVAGEHWTDGSTTPLAGGGDNGAILFSALGIAADAPLVIEGSQGRDQWLARQMALALFPVTLGEVVGTLSRPAHHQPDPGAWVLGRVKTQLHSSLPFARDHFSSYVRGRGPLPTLRVGRQPYGVLPVMPSLSACSCGARPAACRRQQVAGQRCCDACLHWTRLQEEPAQTEDVLDILRLLRPFWEQASGAVPRLSSGPGQASALARVLCLSAVPAPGGYRVRDILGPQGQKDLQAKQLAAADRVEPGETRFQRIAATLIEDSRWTSVVNALTARRLLSTIEPRLQGTQLEELALAGVKDLRVDVATTIPSRSMKGPVDYLRRLAEQRWFFSLLAAQDDTPEDLLYVLVEYSISLGIEQDAEALAAATAEHAFLRAASVGRELVSTGLTAGRTLDEIYTARLAGFSESAAAAGLGDLSIADVLLDDAAVDAVVRGTSFEGGRLRTYSTTTQAVANLAKSGLPDADYERLTGETLATVSTRFDAWVTSLAAARLDTMRKRQAEGLQFGAWGVLVELVPQPREPAADFDATAWKKHLELAEDELAVLQTPLDQVGYVHAPSLGQAVTAGVLRAGEVAHRGDDTTVASIDLTSGRVRLAQEVLTGMQNGQPLGALLGYRLERLLQEDGLHDVVAALRDSYPQRRYAGAEGAAAGDDDVVPPEVVDGYEVWRYRDQVAAVAAVPPRILEQLDRMVQSVADLIVAEGLHQITSGRAESAGATFDAVAYGAQPPEPAFTQEPRSGATVTHNLLVTGDLPGTPGWNEDTPRARMALHAERWAQQSLGPASGWVLQAYGQSIDVSELSVCALDVLAETRGSPATRLAGPAPLDGVADALTGMAFDDRLLAHVGAAGNGDLGDDEQRLRLYALAETAYDVLAGARPVVPRDVQFSEAADANVVRVASADDPDQTALNEVAMPLSVEVQAVQDAIAAVVEVFDDEPVPNSLDSTFLAPFARAGIPGSRALGPFVPLATVGAAVSAALALLRDVDTIIDGMRPRMVDDDHSVALDDTNRPTYLLRLADVAGGLEALVKVARRIGGDAVLPCIKVTGHLGAHRVTGAKAGSAERWLARMSRVRPAMGAFEDLTVFGEAAGVDAELNLFQVPWKPAEGWLGGELASAVDDDANTLHRHRLPGGPRRHLVAAGPVELLEAGEMHAFVVDEVTEVLPADTVTTGVALNYNAPNARPPQSMLLALHPNQQTPWTWQLAVECVRESVALAKLRGVDLDDLAPLGIDEYLPLTYIKEREGATKLSVLTPRFAFTETAMLAATSANRAIVGML